MTAVDVEADDLPDDIDLDADDIDDEDDGLDDDTDDDADQEQHGGRRGGRDPNGPPVGRATRGGRPLTDDEVRPPSLGRRAGARSPRPTSPSGSAGGSGGGGPKRRKGKPAPTKAQRAEAAWYFLGWLIGKKNVTKIRRAKKHGRNLFAPPSQRTRVRKISTRKTRKPTRGRTRR